MKLWIGTALLTLAATAHADPRKGLIRLDDYPPEALARGEQGKVTVELVVSPEGRVVGCKVVKKASHLLDRATCRILTERARYKPATDDAGNPVSATVTGSVEWRIPGVPPARFKPNTTRM